MAKLDLYDIQGNIVKAYGRFGFPKARYVFFGFSEAVAAQQFVEKIIPLVTTSERWGKDAEANGLGAPPKATTNIAFSYRGLKQLGLPRQSLQSFPADFSMGMKARHKILGDDGASAPCNWDPIWRDNDVHCWVSINGGNESDIETRYQKILGFVEDLSGGVKLLSGHRGADNSEHNDYQQASALFDNDKPTQKEHFGYTDGISDPFFKGSEMNPANVMGGGKRTRNDPETIEGWEALEAGEFILGHRDEAFEYPVNAAQPRLLSLNGTYMVYRKLHENVGAFNAYIKNIGKDFSGGSEAVAAKFVGRWRNGAPISRFPTEDVANQFVSKLEAAKQALKDVSMGGDGRKKQSCQRDYDALRKQLVAFDFSEDFDGARCPVGAHARRVNPRGALEFGQTKAFVTPGALVNRRRIARRGLPYGEAKDPSSNTGNHGIIFMAINASIERQFEFIQQQWVNYSNDFKLANDKDPLVGNHEIDMEGNSAGKMIIEGDKDNNTPPFFCSGMPRFVETRGGEYFFMPSLTALKMISEGVVDPT